ncbi:MAG: hypothetical protein AAFU77_18125, partial [Myxococcota bacterium]
MSRVPFVSVVAVLVAAGQAACGFDACGEAAESTASTAPRLENLRFANQLDGDPWTLVFGAQFTDVDGDLQPGFAEFHLNGATEPSGRFPLESVFRQSALPPDAQGGELALTLRLVRPVDDGSDLRVGLRLIDSAGQPSNCYPVEVEFSVSQIGRS